MNIFNAIFLGIVQGIAEFLPISSSGHLAVFQNLFHISVAEDDLFFDVLLHLGTLVSVLLVYRKDILSMLKELFAPKQSSDGNESGMSRRLFWLLVVATVPLVLAAVFKDFVEGLYENLFFISAAFLVTGCLLFFSDRFGSGKKRVKEASVTDALIVGAGQMLAVVPGLSRSGTTIAAGMFCGFKRSFAVKFSFLLSIPAIVGAAVASLPDAIRAGIEWSNLPMYLAGMLTSAVLGYFSIRLLDRISRKGAFGGFAYYCWGAGILTFFLTLIS